MLERIGRNLILFQQIEHALKGLIALGSICNSSISGLRPSLHQSQSLGLVAAAFIQRHLSSPHPVIPEVDLGDDEIILQSSFRIEGAAAVDLAEGIKRAVPDRNRLAHLLISDFDLSSGDGIRGASAWLDETHAEHTQLLEMLRQHHRSVREGFEIVAAFLISEQGMEEMLVPDIQRTAIIQRMLRVAEARSQANDDGWIPASDAAKGDSRSDVQLTLSNFGKKSLTELMLSSRLFELRAAESPGGGTRMLYRLARYGSLLPSDP